MFGIGELFLLAVVASILFGAFFVTLAPYMRSRGALRQWAATDDGEVVGSRARLKARREIEAFHDTHNRAGNGWAARTSGLGISGATTLWIERRRSGFTDPVRDDDTFDHAFFVGGDGGPDLDGVLQLEAFRASVRALFDRVNPAAVELDVDGNLIVRTARSYIDPAQTRALLDATALFVDALTALAHEVKLRSRTLAAGSASVSVGGESGAPMPVPAQRE